VKTLNSQDAGFAETFAALLAERDTAQDVHGPVAAIIADVQARGDAALIDYTACFDRLTLTPGTLRFTADEIQTALDAVPADLMAALDLAASRIEAFHRAQLPKDIEFTDAAGLCLGMRWGALDAVGLYVPGGKAAYPSSVLMNAIPARVAGVGRIAMVVPTPDGVVNNLVLAAAHRAGVTEVYRVGGAQAVAALAYGTATIAPVDRIVGPGNAYVAEAKRQVFGRVGIDSIAGPSEVLIVADDQNDPRHIAVDLLAQAEHDELAQAVLITNSADFAARVAEAVAAEIPTLPRAEIAGTSWRDHGAVIIVRDWDEAAALVNQTAPEHLEVMLADPRAFFARVRHAGAAFLGRFCPEAVGDYVGGPNHVLPTGRTARFASGLSVYDFLKRTTWIEANEAALAQVGPAAVALAQAEGLQAHGRSVSIRLGNMSPGRAAL